MTATRSSDNSTAMILYSTAPKPKLDWAAKIVINEEYIAGLLLKVTQTFAAERPYAKFSNFIDQWSYPAKDIENLLNDPNLPKKYNPLELALSNEVSSLRKFYKDNQINDTWARSRPEYYIGEKDAVVTYLDFIKQYNLAYIYYLKSINGEPEALQKLVTCFTTKTMFTDSLTNTAALGEIKDFDRWLLSLLTHLSFNILFSKDDAISTIARARALAIVVDNFNLENVADAFQSYAGKQYDLARNTGDVVKVYNLIPKKFVTQDNETGTAPQNQLFFKNETIRNIFKISGDQLEPRAENLLTVFGTIIAKHLVDAIHILHGALRCTKRFAYNHHNFENIFIALFKLSKLDNLQKETIFNENASYRNGGENKINPSAGIDWVLGLQSFGSYLNEDELNQLGNEQLKIRVRQQAYRIYQLEAALVNAEKDAALNSLNRYNDPNGYLQRMLMPADSMDEPDPVFEDRLHRNYRVLSQQYHPDRPGGSHELFTAMQEAYAILNDRLRRANYFSLNNFGDITDTMTDISDRKRGLRTPSLTRENV